MQAEVEIDKASRRKMEAVMRQFIATTGKTAEEGVEIVAFSSGRRLVNTVQPYGMSQSKGELFEKNIVAQILHVMWGVNAGVYAPSSSMKEAHNRMRRNGRIRIGRQSQTDKYVKRIAAEDAFPYAAKQANKAGRAKAAWVTAVNSINKSKMSGIPKWIARHVGSSYGMCHKSGKGMQHKIVLENLTPYMTARMQNSKAVAQAAVDGLKNGYKRIQKIIDKEIEKANRAMQ